MTSFFKIVLFRSRNDFHRVQTPVRRKQVPILHAIGVRAGENLLNLVIDIGIGVRIERETGRGRRFITVCLLTGGLTVKALITPGGVLPAIRSTHSTVPVEDHGNVTGRTVAERRVKSAGIRNGGRLEHSQVARRALDVNRDVCRVGRIDGRPLVVIVLSLFTRIRLPGRKHPHKEHATAVKAVGIAFRIVRVIGR